MAEMFGNKRRRVPVSKDDIKKAIKKANDRLQAQNKKIEADIKDAKKNLKAINDELAFEEKQLVETRINTQNAKQVLADKKIELDSISMKQSSELTKLNDLRSSIEFSEENLSGLLKDEIKITKSISSMNRQLKQRDGLAASIKQLKKENDDVKNNLKITQNEVELINSDSVAVRSAKDSLESEFNAFKEDVIKERDSIQSEIDLLDALKQSKQKEYDTFASQLDNQMDEVKEELAMHEGLSKKAENDYIEIQSDIIISEKKLLELEEKSKAVLKRQEDGIKRIKDRYESWKINELDKIAKLKIKGKIDNIDRAGLKDIFDV